MSYTKDQVSQMYQVRLQALLNKIGQSKQDKLDKEAVDFQKQQENMAKLSMVLTGANLYKDLWEGRQQKLKEITFGEPKLYEAGEGVTAVPQKVYEKKLPRSFGEVVSDPIESLKRLTPKGSLQETPEFQEFQAETAQAAEELERARGMEVLDMESTIDEPIPYEPIMREEDVWTPPTAPAIPPDYENIRAAADSSMKTKFITDVDPDSPDFDPGRTTPALPENIQRKGVVEQAGPEGAPLPEAPPSEAPTVPDAKPSLGAVAGKAIETGQTALQLSNIGKTITDADSTGEEKNLARLQGTKILADLATKYSKQKTISDIGSSAFKHWSTKKGLQEGVKLTGKQVVGAGLGAALGGYTAVTEAKEFKESWREKDYDEAVLHAVASGSGGLQTAGAGMMATGVGAPLGAVLYGIGTAGSVISSTALFFEGLFGKKDEPKKEIQRPRFDIARYFDTIRRERRY